MKPDAAIALVPYLLLVVLCANAVIREFNSGTRNGKIVVTLSCAALIVIVGLMWYYGLYREPRQTLHAAPF